MKIAILEDNEIFTEIIETKLRLLGFDDIYTYTCGEDFFAEIIVFDFIILDIELPKMDGILISKRINPKTKIIFLTSLSERVFEAFRINVIGYILKTENIDNIINKIVSLIDEHYIVKNVTFRTRDGICELHIADIIKITKENRKIYIYTIRDIMHVYDLTLHQILDMAPDHFVLVNRSSIINLDKVVSLNHNLINLQCNINEIISRNNLSEVKSKLLRRLV